jgi:hypothetical protein
MSPSPSVTLADQVALQNLRRSKRHRTQASRFSSAIAAAGARSFAPLMK